MKVPSMTDPTIQYDVDLDKKVCTCPAFKKGYTRPCKHLKALGVEPDGFAILEDPKGLKVKDTKVRLFTIGHSNLSVKQFADLLEQHNIQTLVDVRARPYSRLSHFNRDALPKLLTQLGITYYYGGKYLGGFGKNCLSVKDERFKDKMQRVVELGASSNTAMMCSEGDPTGCHRAVKLTAYLHRTHKFDLTHILRKGTINSREFEASHPKSWLWYEFGGEYGADEED